MVQSKYIYKLCEISSELWDNFLFLNFFLTVKKLLARIFFEIRKGKKKVCESLLSPMKSPWNVILLNKNFQTTRENQNPGCEGAARVVQ